MRREEAVKVLEKAIKQEEKEKAIKEEEEEKAIKVCCEKAAYKVGGTSVGRESDILVIEWIGVLLQYISAKNIHRRKSAADAVTSSAQCNSAAATATVQCNSG